jgi:hypothetical protein
LQTRKNNHSEGPRGRGQPNLSASKAQSHYRQKPKRCRRGHPQYQIVSSQNRSAANKTDACENSQREPHNIEVDERIGVLPDRAEQEIRLKHCDARCERDEHCRSQPGRVPVLSSIKSDAGRSNER